MAGATRKTQVVMKETWVVELKLVRVLEFGEDNESSRVMAERTLFSGQDADTALAIMRCFTERV